MAGLAPGSMLIGSDLHAWHRLWTDYGLTGSNRRSAKCARAICLTLGVHSKAGKSRREDIVRGRFDQTQSDSESLYTVEMFGGDIAHEMLRAATPESLITFAYSVEGFQLSVARISSVPFDPSEDADETRNQSTS